MKYCKESLSFSVKGNHDIGNEGLSASNFYLMDDIEHFYIASCNLRTMNGIESLVNLKSLDMPHNKIPKITGLRNLVNLETLILRSNHIEEIEGLSNLINLKELNLNSNDIRKIEGLDNLKKLEFLYLSQNYKIHVLENIHNLPNLKGIDIGFGMRIKYVRESSYRHIIDNKIEVARLTILSKNLFFLKI